LSATEALGFAAVELFNERATAAVEDFVLSDNDVPYVLEICRRLDGMPLALAGCGKSRSVVLPARFVAFCPFVTR
jgi:predicted ATPase